MGKVNFNWRGEQVIKAVKEAGFNGICDGAEHILTESIDETPVLSGTLRRSGTVTPVPKKQAAYISFNTPYAVAVHEGLDPRVIHAREAKVLAVPVSKWKGGAVNSYKSDKLPKYSKDGQYVILGRKVNHPGTSGAKYLETPFNLNKARVLRLVKKRVSAVLGKR